MKTRIKSTEEATGASDTIEGAMSRPFARRTFLKGALATAPLLLMDPARLWAKKAEPDDENNIGPSTTTEPYLIPSILRWRVTTRSSSTRLAPLLSHLMKNRRESSTPKIFSVKVGSYSMSKPIG